jgi:hypothetical protein
VHVQSAERRQTLSHRTQENMWKAMPLIVISPKNTVEKSGAYQ